MAGNISDYLENKILGHVTGQTSYTAPTTTYAALYTTAPTDAGGGVEVTGTGYARIAVTWGTPASGSITNTNILRFPAASGAGSAWGTVVAIGIFDALSSGNLLWYGNLSAS